MHKCVSPDKILIWELYVDIILGDDLLNQIHDISISLREWFPVKKISEGVI